LATGAGVMVLTLASATLAVLVGVLEADIVILN
jgi:hypothetical protein